LLAYFVTRTFELRFVCAAVIGAAALLAVGLAEFLRNNRTGILALILLFAAIAFVGLVRADEMRGLTQSLMSTLRIEPTVKAALLANPGRMVYFQDLRWFAFASYYEPDPTIRSRIALVYSREEEIHWLQTDTGYLTMLHMRNFTKFNIVPYESLMSEPGDYFFLDCSSPKWDCERWNWIHGALATSLGSVSPVGTGFCGDVVSVRIRHESK
jgi:hypothetical protein